MKAVDWFGPLSAEARMINLRAMQQREARLSITEPVDPDVITIKISGTIGDATAEMVERRLAAAPNAQEISLVIDCRGGTLGAAERIHNLVRRHGAKVTSRALSLCASAATVVLLAGDVRECKSDTEFLLHEVSIEPAGARWTADHHTQTAARLRASNTRMANFYSERTGYWASKFLAEMRNEAPMTAERARDEFGLVHRILT